LFSAAPFWDRVVHHALCNVIEPWFERRFIFDSYANRPGKGTHRAVNRRQRVCIGQFLQGIPETGRDTIRPPCLPHQICLGLTGQLARSKVLLEQLVHE
jgi:hypothetical protein